MTVSLGPLPSRQQKNALAGTSGTPDTGNEYVTKVDPDYPSWVKITKTFTDFSTAGSTNSITGYTLGAGGIIHAVKIKHSAAFTGGTIASYTIEVGISGTETKYAPAFDVFQAPGNTVQQLSSTVGTENHGASTAILFTAISGGDTLDNATTGSVDIWILVSRAI